MMMPFVFFSKDFTVGSVSVISQSGGVGNTFLHALPGNHVFLNKFVAVGNKLQLDEADFLSYYLSDPGTSAIVAYLEGFSRGREFFDFAMAADKPVIVQKIQPQRGERQHRAVPHHRALVGGRHVEAAFRQSAVIRVEDEEELVSAAKIMQLPSCAAGGLPCFPVQAGMPSSRPMRVTNSRFEMVPFPESFIQKVKSMYKSRVISHQNPLDLGEIFDYTIFINILREAIALPEIDGVLFNHLYQSEYESGMSRTFLDSVGVMVRDSENRYR